MNATTGRWELAEHKRDVRADGPDDDTETFGTRSFGRGGGDFPTPFSIPKGPRAGNKRVRTQDDRMAQLGESIELDY